MQINYCFGEEGQAYWTKGHVPLDEFMTEVEYYVEGSDDRIMQEKPVHCWVRVCRDFQEGRMLIVKANPGSHGAFQCTWLQVY